MLSSIEITILLTGVRARKRAEALLGVAIAAAIVRKLRNGTCSVKLPVYRNEDKQSGVLIFASRNCAQTTYFSGAVGCRGVMSVSPSHMDSAI